MANARMPMRKVREILRMKLEMGLSHREVVRALHVSPGLVGSTMSQAAALGLKWADLVALDEAALEERLHGPRPPPPVSARPMPDLARVHVERRRAGVTLELLHLEYLEAHPD